MNRITIGKVLVNVQVNSRSSPYIVSLKTLVLEPVFVESRLMCRAIEEDKILTYSHSPLHSIRNSCRHYGHSFENAMEVAKKFLRKLHKPPIIVAYNYGGPIPFFPTLSPNAPDNIWIALHAVANVRSLNNACIIHLINGDEIKVNVSASTIYRQVALANWLEKDQIRKYQELSRF
ncbi:competence protein ComK [Sporosarcina jiandibaonis]|uniref:competence protein ComK n=1 Tax=Sporosarcina jiandibaonis TaxID=2715535 RepID=UPI0024834E45|nr:competence protein ComK [Sporosarcina jiandibaonis]